MSQTSYLYRVFRGASVQRLRRVIEQVHEKSGQNRVYTLLDMVNCAVRYGAGYHDYLIFAFWSMNHRQRSTYLTRLRNRKLNVAANDENYTDIFDKKNQFDRRFASYLGREFRDVAGLSLEDFAAFAADKKVLFAKPNVGESGKGIQRLRKEDFDGVEAMYAYVTDPSHNFGVVEEALTQHPDLNVLYPGSINSYRIVTLVTEGKPECVYAVAKCGSGGKFVDNMENGGLCCPIDQVTGRICGCAHTSALVNYDVHPDTGVTLMGFQLPYVREAISLSQRAAMEVPQVRYIGWDVCVTPTGPVIIEGNTYPGYDFWQLPEHTPDRIGLWPYFKDRVQGL